MPTTGAREGPRVSERRRKRIGNFWPSPGRASETSETHRKLLAVSGTGVGNVGNASETFCRGPQNTAILRAREGPASERRRKRIGNFCPFQGRASETSETHRKLLAVSGLGVGTASETFCHLRVVLETSDSWGTSFRRELLFWGLEFASS